MDLRYSPAPLLELSAEEIAELQFTKVQDLPEGIDRIPIKSIHINRCPIVLTPKLVDEKVAQRLSLDWSQCEKHRAELMAFSGLAKKLQAVVTIKQFDNSGKDAEALLYDGFIPNNDKPLMQGIPNTDADTLAKSVYPFQDKRLPDLLFRYRARNFPGSLNADEQQDWLQFCRDKLLSADSNGLDAELENIQRILQDKNDKDTAEILGKLTVYLTEKKQRLS